MPQALSVGSTPYLYVASAKGANLIENVGLMAGCKAEEVSPVVVLPGAPQTLAPGDYVLAEVSIEVQPTKPQGVPWDANSKPDPEILILLDDREFYNCAFVKDVLKTTCKVVKPMKIEEKTSLQIVVLDNDQHGLVRSESDVIGHGMLDALTLRAKTGAPTPMDVSGALRSATILFLGK